MEKIGKYCSGKASFTKLIVQTRLLTSKKHVRLCLKKSKVKTVQVVVGSKKQNKKTAKKYKKVFKKKTVGKKVKIARYGKSELLIQENPNLVKGKSEYNS